MMIPDICEELQNIDGVLREMNRRFDEFPRISVALDDLLEVRIKADRHEAKLVSLRRQGGLSTVCSTPS